MKVLQVNCVYKKGSTGKIVYDIHQTLIEKNIESIVCYGRGKLEDDGNIYKTSSEICAKFNNLKSRLTGMQYDGSYLATRKLIKIILKEKPTVVHLHCINGYFVNIYKLLEFLKKSGIKTILTLHAEFMYTGNCGYSYECERWKIGCGKCPQLKNATNSLLLDKTNKSWLKMKKAFDKFDNLVVVSVSPWLESRAIQSPILKDKNNCTVLNGIDTKSIFYHKDFQNLKKKHGIKNEKIILHVTSDFTSEAKGGKYIIDIAKRLTDKNLKIIVIGNKNKEVALPDNIIDIGSTENQKELAMYYSMADLTVITSKRETFSMVCAESLSCGTPVVGFKAGAPEQISLSEYSEFIEYGDIDALVECVIKWIEKKDNIKYNLESLAKEYYSKDKMCEGYIRLYEK